MIYRLPLPGEPIDQGDIVDSCPLLLIDEADSTNLESIGVTHVNGRIIVLTQTCDLAAGKTNRASIASGQAFCRLL